MQPDGVIRIIVIIILLAVLIVWRFAPALRRQTRDRSQPTSSDQVSTAQLTLENHFSRVPSPYPSTKPQIELRKAIQFANRQEFEPSIAEFTKFIQDKKNQTSPWLELAYMYRALVYQSVNQLDYALADYDEAIRINPSSIQGYINRADFKLHCLDDAQGALEDADFVLKNDPDQLGAYLIRGVARAKLGLDGVFADFDRAFELSRHINHAPIYVQRGQAHYALNNLTAALKDFREAIRLDSSQADHCLGMMAQIFRDRGDFKQALAIYDERLRHQPNSINIYMVRGFVRHRFGDTVGAIVDYEKVMELNPKYAGAYNNRAWVYLNESKFDAALNDCQMAINRDVNFVYVYGTRATVYFLLGKLNDALSDFNKAIEIKSDHKYAILGQAITLYHMGKRVEARERWNTLYSMDTKYATKDNLREEVLVPQAFLEASMKLEAEFHKSDEQ